MTKHTITMELELDAKPTSYVYTAELRPHYTYFFDIPRIDLAQYAHARIRITTADAKEEP